MMLISSFSALANECASVDQTLRAYEVGMATSTDITYAIECNLAQVTSTKTLCETKIGLNKDQLNIVESQYEVGLVVKDVVDQAKANLAAVEEACN